MKKIAVRYEKGFFLELDQVRLRRKARDLRAQILQKIDPQQDVYDFYSTTLPFLDSAIGGAIVTPLAASDESFLSANYRRDALQGELPAKYDREFTRAVAGFSVTVRAFALEIPQEFMKDSVTYAWREVEEEGDGPETTKYW